MDDTEADFKDMTGSGLDDVDIAGITEVDELAVDEPLIADDEIVPAPVITDDGSLTEEEAVPEEEDEMLDYIYGEELHSR